MIFCSILCNNRFLLTILTLRSVVPCCNVPFSNCFNKVIDSWSFFCKRKILNKSEFKKLTSWHQCASCVGGEIGESELIAYHFPPFNFISCFSLVTSTSLFFAVIYGLGDSHKTSDRNVH